jgi:hypothetical protein
VINQSAPTIFCPRTRSLLGIVGWQISEDLRTSDDTSSESN